MARPESFVKDRQDAGLVVTSDRQPRNWFSERQDVEMERVDRHGAVNMYCMARRQMVTRKGAA